jgi:hypothetical protein
MILLRRIFLLEVWRQVGVVSARSSRADTPLAAGFATRDLKGQMIRTRGAEDDSRCEPKLKAATAVFPDVDSFTPGLFPMSCITTTSQGGKNASSQISSVMTYALVQPADRIIGDDITDPAPFQAPQRGRTQSYHESVRQR